jgi:predicted transcriptional regulator
MGTRLQSKQKIRGRGSKVQEISAESTPDDKTIEAIDRDISRAKSHAVNIIRDIYASPFRQIKQARLQRRVYKLHLLMLLSNLDLSGILEGLTQVLDKTLPAPSNLDKAQQLLQAVQKSVKEITKKVAELRVTYLEDQARTLDNVKDKKAALMRKRILKAEAIKTMYMKLQQYLKP